MSRQVLLGADIQLTNLVGTLTFLVSADLLHSSPILSRHAIFYRNIALLLYSVPCYLLRCLLRHTELCRDRDYYNCFFFSSSFLLKFSHF